MQNLTNEDLVCDIHAGNNVQENLLLLYQQNFPFIQKIAKPYLGYVEKADLLQEAFFAIKESVDAFKPERGLFLTIAEFYLRNAFRKVIYNAQSVTIPYHAIEKLKQIGQEREKHQKKTGQDPGLPEELQAAAAAVNVDSLNRELETGGTLGDIIPDPRDLTEEIEEKLYQEQLQRDLWSAVDALPEQQSDVIRKNYQENKSLAEISKEIGKTVSDVTSTKEKAMRALRKKHAKQLRRYLYSAALQGTGVSRFRQTRTSATERLAIKLYQGECE